MAAPNIVNVTTITGLTTLVSVIVSAVDLVVNTTASGKVFKINSIIVANVDGTNAADVTVDLFRGGEATHIVKTVAVDADSSFSPIDKNSAIYLEEGDKIRVTGSADDDLQAICSYEEIS